jgi:hypothetical protein
MKISRLLPRTFALAGLAVVGAGAAYAQSITPVFISTTGAAGNVTYTYQLFSTADTKVAPGDVFTFYDFNGLLTGGTNTPTFVSGQLPAVGIAYTITTPLTGINPPGTVALAGDDPTLPNVSLTYSGTTFVNPGPGSQLLGTLTLHSLNPINGAGDFTPFAANTTKNSNSSPAGNQGFVSGPNTAPPPTPEPGTWAMLFGMSVSGAAFARRRNRRK